MDSTASKGHERPPQSDGAHLGRISKDPAAALIDLYESPHLERETAQFPYFIKVDLAHVSMLAEQQILSYDQAGQLLTALQKLSKTGPSALNLDPSKGSMLFHIERFLVEEIGEDIGRRLHIGRSRLDQGPTVRRLFKRDMVLHVLAGILALRRTLIGKAQEHQATIMPGYTCLQHAHPAVFGHYLLSFDSKLKDDFDRLVGGYDRLNRSPLGGAGLSGTSWTINRKRTADLLGFDGLIKNAKLVREAYYAAEIAAALAMTMSTLNDLATDLHIWSSYEFGLVEVADEFSGTSSIFPQKKNPTGLEAVKFVAGEAVSWPAIILTTFRAEGTGDIVMREAPILDRASKATSRALNVMAPVVETLKVNAQHMQDLACANWSTATALADMLVHEHNLSFRTAHGLVARLVALCLKQGLGPKDADAALLNRAAGELGIDALPNVTDGAIQQAFDVVHFTQTRASEGSVSPAEVSSLLKDAESGWSESEQWLNAATAAIERANICLEEVVGSIQSQQKSSCSPSR